MSRPVDDFAAELRALGASGARVDAQVVVAATGTLGPRAVTSPGLHRRLAAAGLESSPGAAHPDLAHLVADPAWHLALVLSPHKSAAAGLDALSPTAAETGVVDTLLRTRSGVVAVNTNVSAAGTALVEAACGRTDPAVLVVGTGASARSVLTACHRWLPGAQVSVTGRRREAVAEVAARSSAVAWSGGQRADIVVNATSWGETPESEEASACPVDLGEVLATGGRLFDLNNRVGALMTQALALGAVVVPGMYMQDVVHGLRASVASI